MYYITHFHLQEFVRAPLIVPRDGALLDVAHMEWADGSLQYSGAHHGISWVCSSLGVGGKEGRTVCAILVLGPWVCKAGWFLHPRLDQLGWWLTVSTNGTIRVPHTSTDSSNMKATRAANG